MTDTTAANETQPPAQPTGWVGWITFAGVMLIIAGCFQAIYGLVAIFNDTWVAWGERGAVFFDVTTWGWIHGILGAVLILAGLGVLSGNLAARIAAVAVATLSAIVAFLAIPLYPIWSIGIIVIDVLVIWAVIVHGREVRTS